MFCSKFSIPLLTNSGAFDIFPCLFTASQFLRLACYCCTKWWSLQNCRQKPSAALWCPIIRCSPRKLPQAPNTGLPVNEGSNSSETTSASPSKAKSSTRKSSNLENFIIPAFPSISKCVTSIVSSQNSSSILGGIDVLGDGEEEVLLPLTSIWNDDHVSKYTDALSKELMTCLWCYLDLGCAHSTRMVHHLLKNRCAGIASCPINIPQQHIKSYLELKNRSIESKNWKQNGREDELLPFQSHQSEAV